jgi:precorrin-4/cobalt-precorrin-4 C11-methyltransferase
MTVHFIGAGPGDPDLITVRGRDLIARCPVMLYAGSLVPPAIVALAPKDALVIDTAPLNLDEIVDHMQAAQAKGQDVARVHSGDPSLYGAIAEQMRRLDQLGIEYNVTPGVPAYAAAAAVLKTELTLPEVSQTVILTRTDGKASPMPNREDLATLGASGATLAIHLSVRNVREIVRELSPHYGADCPAVVAYRVGWPDQLILRGTLENIGAQIRDAKITRTALIFVGRVFESRDFTDSKLYDAAHRHILRPGVPAKKRPPAA